MFTTSDPSRATELGPEPVVFAGGLMDVVFVLTVPFLSGQGALDEVFW
jgi:hypothetical protein